LFETLQNELFYAKVFSGMEQLQERLSEIEELKSKLNEERGRIQDEIKTIREEERRKNPKLCMKERCKLYKQLRALSSGITGDGVLFSSISIVDEEPMQNKIRGYAGVQLSDKYSIDIECGLIDEYGGPGMSYKAAIRTKNPGVVDMVRECFKQEFDYSGDEEEELRTHWWRDWDYHTNFVFRDPTDAQDLLRMEDIAEEEGF
jgi:hypothetical protein